MSNGNTLNLRSSGLQATIALTGAQMQSLKTAGGLELLWHGDPDVWPDHAPILFPLLGPLTNQKLRHRGEAYDIPPHGFAQHRTFQVIEQSENRCLLETSDDAETRAMYPFGFRLEVEYELLDRALHHSMTVTNTSDETLPCDVGFHPGFQWPLMPGVPKESYRITFEREEPAPMRRGIDDPIFLYGDPHPTPVKGHVLHLSEELFEDQAMVFDRLNSRSLTYHADDGPVLQIEFPDCPYLAVWMRPGATFVAIEPWQGLPAEYGWDGEFMDKPGVAHVESGATNQWRLIVHLKP